MLADVPLFGTTGQEHAIFVEVDAMSGPRGEVPRRNMSYEKSKRRLPRANSVGVGVAWLRAGGLRNRCGHQIRAVNKS